MTRQRWGLTLVAYFFAVLMFFPIFWMFLTAFKTEPDAFSLPPQFLFQPTLDSIREAISRSDYGGHMRNSVISAVGSTLVALLLALPISYGLAFHPNKRSNGILVWIVSTRMMPAVGVVMPIYLIYRQLQWLDNIYALALLYAFMNLPIIIWTLYAYFREIPLAIMEAARVDGANLIQEIFTILLPIALPAVASAAMLSIIFAWNEAFWSFTLTSADATPLSVYVSSFKTAEGFFWAKMSAASMFAVLPVMVMGWISQRYLVQGLTFGAVK